MSWRPVRTADGSWTLAHASHGATCHSLSGAWQQARERYAAPCRLRELGEGRDVVRVLDVGTGLGLNIAAALEALNGTGARLDVLTLERDRSVLEAAFELRDWPAEVAPWQCLAHAALKHGSSSNTALTLELVLGDARETLRALDDVSRFDAVFFDPFAPAVEPDSWSRELFLAVASRMDPVAVLSTYSSSLAARVAIASTGLAVGAGPRVGAKSSGTLASWRAPLPPLDARTRGRIERRLARAR